ncbi:MAG: caspase family protein, partial [Mesorhizobium sp.]
MRLFNIALAVIALIGGLEVAWAEKRVALVIGNSSYQRVARLPNPNNDAADMAALLSKVGFEVSRKMDLDHTAFRKALQEFGREAEGADFAIIFFAGHGVEVENRNFLVPTDVSLSADSDVEFEAIPLDLVMNALSRVSGVRVVLLDACRDNPFIAAMRRSNATRSIGRGLAAIEPAAGTLVGYAAKEGTTAFDGAGRNSPYTAGLLAHLGEPGVDIQFVFRKVRDTVLA